MIGARLEQGVSASGRPIRKVTLQSDAAWPNAFMAIYGAAWCFTIPFVGQIYAAEVFALIMLPFVDPRGTLRTYPVLLKLLISYFVILISLVVSDFVNNTGTMDFLRGWANLVFAAVEIVFVVSCLRRNIGSILYFLAFTVLFKAALGDATYALKEGIALLSVNDPNYFKVRYVPFLLPAIVLASYFIQKLGRAYAALFLGVCGIFFVVLDARSAGLALVLASLLIASLFLRVKITWSNVSILVLPLMLIGQLVYVGYVDYTLKNNAFGQSGKQLSQVANPYNPISLLLQGRSEWTVAGAAISDKPIFGHGSWAIDYDRRYAALRAERTRGVEAFYASFESRNFLIPAHSVFLGVWLWGGLIGLFGIFLMIKQLIKLIVAFYKIESPFFVISSVFIPLLMWDFLFSPVQVLRLTFPHYIGLLVVLSNVIALKNPDFRDRFYRGRG